MSAQGKPLENGTPVRIYTAKNRRSWWDAFAIREECLEDGGPVYVKVRHTGRVVNGREVEVGDHEEKGWYLPEQIEISPS